MKTQVEFRSSKFPPYEGEQEQINPGLWGKRLAEYLVQCDAHPNGVAAMTWQRCANYYFMQFNSWEYMYYQNRDSSIPQQLWVEADAYFKMLVQTKPGYVCFWKEMETAFDESFRSYATQEFRRRAASGHDH